MIGLRDIAFWRTEFWFPSYPPKVKESRRTTWYSRKEH